MTIRAFQIHPDDNVAVLMDDCGGGVVHVIGEGDALIIEPAEPIKSGHKIALHDIPAGAAVVKFGARIGHATKQIAAGAWVHLHNCASDLDERSGTLDNESGAPTDTCYE